MAAGRVPAPGTKNGPCKGSCRHQDCTWARMIAERELCPTCKKPIGYDVGFIRADPDSGNLLWEHELCALERVRVLAGRHVNGYDADMEWVVSLQSGAIENGNQGKLAELDDQLVQELWGAPVFEGAGLAGFTTDRALGVAFQISAPVNPWVSLIGSSGVSVPAAPGDAVIAVDRALRSMGLPGVAKVEVEPADGD